MPQRNTAQVETDDELEGQQDPPERTLREEIEAARDAIVGGDEEGGGQAAAGAGAEPAARSGEAADAARARDPGGRFQRREGQQPPAPSGQTQPAPGAPSAAGDAAAGAKPAAGAAPAVGAPPARWSETAKAQWAQLPEWARTEVIARETAMHRELTRQDGERQLARQFTEVINKYPDVIQRSGVHPLRFVSDVMEVMKTLTHGNPVQKAALLRDVAQRNGVDFRALLGAPPGGAPGAPGQPGGQPPAPVFQLPPHIERFATEWAQFKDQQATQQREANERMATQVLAEIDAFRGDPKNRYFEQVRDHMEVLLAGGAANTLAEAYDMAIHAHPEVRKALEAEATAAAAAEARRREQAQQARRRGISVRSGAPAPASTGEKPAGERSLREELQHNFAEARSRL